MTSVCLRLCPILSTPSFFFFNGPATREIYTLSLHDALPISVCRPREVMSFPSARSSHIGGRANRDRKSTRLNSSHLGISYAVFCLKNKTTRACRHPTHIQATHRRTCNN